jgi:hypothetical protein
LNIMKLIIAASALALASARIAQPEQRKLQEVTSCFIDRNFNFPIETTEGCSYQLLRDRMEEKIASVGFCSNDPDDELAAIFGADVEAFIEGKCQEAYDAARDVNEFGLFNNKGDQFDKEYFDGGTYINEERETIEDGVTKYNLKTDFVRYDNLYNGRASKKTFSFPDNLTNFEDCDIGAAFCCWSADRQAGDNNGNCATPYDDNCVDADPGDNTDVCSVDMARFPEAARVPGGTIQFPGDTEGDIHCHGFAWSTDENHPSSFYKGNNLFYVSMYDHFYQRGYVRNVPGAPMCACAEKMPIVSRADCTEIEATHTFRFFYNGKLDKTLTVTLQNSAINFNACQGANNNNNDLEAYFQRLVDEGEREATELATLQQTIVGQCPA